MVFLIGGLLFVGVERRLSGGFPLWHRWWVTSSPNALRVCFARSWLSMRRVAIRIVHVKLVSGALKTSRYSCS
ncbi:hypothetical protein CC80DRAFT_82029 [Byssothecium circinans]|uniref:Uncharacterized protein n=1 Tax=Byssothecium circinans TaxID=147558 RepID=A0A6A5TU14_9PLEO|nr:hypothetical protein CC80DRAFT_82029 [Byssothecium circinans]